MATLRGLTAEALMAALPNGVLVCDGAGRVALANAAAHRLLGETQLEEVALDDLLPGADWRGALEGREVTVVLCEGRVRAIAAPLRDGSAVTGVALLLHEPAVDIGAGKRGQQPGDGEDPFAALVGESVSMRRIRHLGLQAARTRSTVLLLGESGTGKELLAQAIHKASDRRRAPFVAVNCAAVPEGLLEAEFFGYAEGAFTGARRGGKPGKFELAAGGTLFLDEIGDLAPALQAKLLRVLQEWEVERVGATRPVRVDVRVIAASNRDLQAMVAAGAFRADLYYRLNVLTLQLAPLREHLADLPLLVAHILRPLQGEGFSPAVSDDAIAAMQRYHWPGNVRELQNVLERAVAFGAGSAIGPADVPTCLPGPAATVTPLRHHVREAERHALLGALEQTGGNKAAAARLLGLSRSQFYEKLSLLAGP